MQKDLSTNPVLQIESTVLLLRSEVEDMEVDGLKLLIFWLQSSLSPNSYYFSVLVIGVFFFWEIFFL